MMPGRSISGIVLQDYTPSVHSKSSQLKLVDQDVYWHLGDARQVNQRHRPAGLHPQMQHNMASVVLCHSRGVLAPW
jgi:hypothetical protein